MLLVLSNRGEFILPVFSQGFVLFVCLFYMLNCCDKQLSSSNLSFEAVVLCFTSVTGLESNFYRHHLHLFARCPHSVEALFLTNALTSERSLDPKFPLILRQSVLEVT